MNLSQRGRYGWSDDGRYHWLPGRLLVVVPGLHRNPGLAAELAERVRRQPGVVAVQASPASGRVLIRFDEGCVTAATLLEVAGVSEPGPPAAADTEPRWQVTSVAPLGDRDPAALLAVATQQPDGGRRPILQWGCFTGRQAVRRLGRRAFHTARSMQRRGERVLCLLKDGRPQGLFGFREQSRPIRAPSAPPDRSQRPGGISVASLVAFGLTLLNVPLMVALPACALIAGAAAVRRAPDQARPQVAATSEAALTSAPLPTPAWHALEPTQVLDAFGADCQGLTAAQAEARLAALGPNLLERRPEPSAARLLLRQFREPMVVVLLGASVLSFLLGERVDAAAILAIVVINAVLAVVQECKTRQALESLQHMTAATARTLRDGEVVVVPADRLVPGDIVCLEEGDRVPADLRLLEAANLLAEEAALTGEPGDVAKAADEAVPELAAIGDRQNMLYAGTFVRSGRGRGLVVATGMATEMGRIAGLLQAAGPGPTPLQRRLAQVNRVLVIGALTVSAALVGIGVARGLPIGQVLVTAISTAVAAIPEGLPITVTIALAVAVYRMGRRKAVVRHLPAVETLGATMTICTDKTGTLTSNQMAVREVWAGGTSYTVQGDGYSPDGQFLVEGQRVDVPPDGDLATALRLGALCSNATLRQQPDGTWTGDGDPTEVALLAAAARAGMARGDLNRRHAREHEVPFQAALRCMAVTCRDEAGRLHAHIKGAPDKLLSACTRWHRQGKVAPITDEDRALIEAQAEAMAAGALRVLAVAYKPLPNDWESGAGEHLQADLVFMGLLGLMDPPRPEARAALDRCRRAGVHVIMVTGDHPRTALAVARELGLAQDGDRAITGAEIERLSEAELAATLEGATVCARVAPEQKLRVVRALRSQGRVVAMTGDGVNDAPAIREADIGIAMGRTGTEVTRATADMVLMDDNFATIVGAIEEGRGTYDNIRRTVRYTLATNIAEVVLMLGAVLLGVPLPLLPVQLLWVNLVCDGVPALSLAFDRPASGCMERPPRRPGEGLFAGGLWTRMTARGVGLGAGTLLLFGALLGATGNLVLARSAALATLITSKLLYLLEVRRDEAGGRGLQPNPVLAGAIALSAALFVGTLYVPALQPFFKTVALGAREWLGVAVVTAAGVVLERLVSGKQADPEKSGSAFAFSAIPRWPMPGAAPLR